MNDIQVVFLFQDFDSFFPLLKYTLVTEQVKMFVFSFSPIFFQHLPSPYTCIRFYIIFFSNWKKICVIIP